MYNINSVFLTKKNIKSKSNLNVIKGYGLKDFFGGFLFRVYLFFVHNPHPMQLWPNLCQQKIPYLWEHAKSPIVNWTNVNSSKISRRNVNSPKCKLTKILSSKITFLLEHDWIKCIVSCLGVVQLGGPDLCYPMLVLLKWGVVSHF